MSRQRKLVVAGLICDREGRVLVTQRRADQSLPLLWEFPGGKIEDGESPEVALERELREEIAARAVVGRIWDVLYHPYESFDLLMLVYATTLADGEVASAVEVADLRWLVPDQLHQVKILPADQPLVARLLREGLPSADCLRGSSQTH